MDKRIRKKIRLAKRTLEDGEYLLEGHRYRAAIGEAYYTMYHCIKALLYNEGISAKSHSGVQTKFYELFIKTKIFPKQYGIMLKQTFNARIASDYNDDYSPSYLETKEFIEYAKVFLNDVITYLES